ncbi:glycerol-3-phosphate 1-O-acyltransferase PlsY [Erysipelothrix sp. strain 2 (EsS2-6-Brazil)]|uniref:glycerol-3-phosphate 1-O-acyltransferase PlsY n=1 Tax=Erysipelothrix sp. strain 2 (EsS2-6-Brazil) TaxID=2500549 RepID=UPI00190E5A8F|nr:glycerol-3-phosphate 1-O-acyltransferase PlsY [Erysipelothrix sp. strain 2 (EsS2-6-Brazil)]MBK2402386.1 glycerol-3-phosphate 1-O-acyltransferase [Erysipelothrix sp. strain 2 (EsS2-6-Brazil)]
MEILLASVLGYLLGSIPNALVIGKLFFNTDIREHGSGNLGGTNAGRTLGAKAGVAVAVLDVLKATIAMVITNFLFPDATIYAGFFATLGHCFPIFAKFKGGKAVSTAMGFLLGISILVTKRPVLHFIVPVLIFFAVLYLSKMVSLSAMISIITAVVILGISQDNIKVTIAFAIIAIIVIYRHRSNIQRIKDGTERKITWM